MISATEPEQGRREQQAEREPPVPTRVRRGVKHPAPLPRPAPQSTLRVWDRS